MAYTPNTLATTGAHGQMVGFATAADAAISREWTYKTSDAIATVNTAGYFSNAGDIGMHGGDLMKVIVMSGSTVSAVYSCAVMAVTSGAADISDGVSLTLTNSD